MFDKFMPSLRPRHIRRMCRGLSRNIRREVAASDHSLWTAARATGTPVRFLLTLYFRPTRISSAGVLLLNVKLGLPHFAWGDE